jgi:hypothetical protein
MTCRISRLQDGGSISNNITIFLAEGIWKVHIFRHYLYVFKLVCTHYENFIRIGISVLYLKCCRCQLWIWRSQISVLLAPLRVASKTAFATIESTIDTSNSSNTVLYSLILSTNKISVRENIMLTFYCLIDWLVFSTNFSNISVIDCMYKHDCISLFYVHAKININLFFLDQYSLVALYAPNLLVTINLIMKHFVRTAVKSV